MNNRLVVSTECPSCGAPLDFSEGSNAIQCDHCRTHLLVTGRKQVLSYSVALKLNAHRAVAKAMIAYKNAGAPCRVIQPQLYFIPYYRLTGQDFLWEMSYPEAEPQPPVIASEWDISTGLDRDFTEHDGEIQFKDRYVEKNFAACDLQGLDMYSLGVRPSVLRLELFKKESLEAGAKVVSATTSPEAALSRGMTAADTQNILYRAVVGRVLSVIYFPFWVVEVEREGQRQLCILDAVSENVIKRDVPLSFYTVLDHSLKSDPPVAGFRPLTCPNCGWDFPVRPDNVIFFCSSCGRAWQLLGTDLQEVSYQIVKVVNTEKESIKYLPFWILQARAEENAPSRFFVPAFRYRRLKHLNDLARNLSRKQPAYTVLDGGNPEVHGCYYDQEDATLLAQFICAGLSSKDPKGYRAFQEKAFTVTDAKLAGVPFKAQGNELLDPFIGQGLLKNLIL